MPGKPLDVFHKDLKISSHASFRADENMRRELERKPTDKAVGFLSSVRFLGAHRKYAHRIHTFRKSAYAQIGVHGGKAWFSLCEKLSKKGSRKFSQRER